MIRARRALVLFPAIATGLAALPAHGAEIRWNALAGGSFHEPANWLGPVAPPGASDVAVFDLDGEYTVQLLSSIQTTIRVLQGTVTLDAGGFDLAQSGLGGELIPPSSGSLTLRDGSFSGFESVDSYGDVELLRVSSGALLSVDDIHIGWDEGGSLEIVDGGITVSSSGTLGDIQPSGGHVLIEGPGSQWLVSGELVAGEDGGALVAVQGGGRLETASARIKYPAISTAGSPGRIIVTGADSIWVNEGELNIGGYDRGELEISDGGRVETGDVFLGRSGLGAPEERIGPGIVSIGGVGSNLRISGSLVLGGDKDPPAVPEGAPGAFGIIRAESGARVEISERLLLWNEASVEIDGGKLNVGSSGVGAIPGELRVYSDGVLSGSGDVRALVRLAGEIDPGGADGESGVSAFLQDLGYVFAGPRLLRVEGHLVAEETATLNFDIAGLASSGAEYDALEIDGVALLNGTLRVWITPDLPPAISEDDLFTVVTADQGVFGSFGNVRNGELLAVDGTEGTFQVFYGEESPLSESSVVLTNFTPVPEPAMTLLWMGGSLTLLSVLRWRRTGA